MQKCGLDGLGEIALGGDVLVVCALQGNDSRPRLLALDCKRGGDTDDAAFLAWPVDEHDRVGVLVVGEHACGNLGDAFADEPSGRVVTPSAFGCLLLRFAGEVGFLGRAVFGVGERPIVEGRCGETLAGNCYRDGGGVAGDPPAPPLLGHGGSGRPAARRVEYKVARVGGHEHAPLDHVVSSLHHVPLVRGRHLPVPHVRHPATRHLVFISLPAQLRIWPCRIEAAKLGEAVHAIHRHAPLLAPGAGPLVAVPHVSIGASRGGCPRRGKAHSPVHAGTVGEMFVRIESLVMGQCPCVSVTQLEHCV